MLAACRRVVGSCWGCWPSVHRCTQRPLQVSTAPRPGQRCAVGEVGCADGSASVLVSERFLRELRPSRALALLKAPNLWVLQNAECHAGPVQSTPAAEASLAFCYFLLTLLFWCCWLGPGAPHTLSTGGCSPALPGWGCCRGGSLPGGRTPMGTEPAVTPAHSRSAGEELPSARPVPWAVCRLQPCSQQPLRGSQPGSAFARGEIPMKESFFLLTFLFPSRKMANFQRNGNHICFCTSSEQRLKFCPSPLPEHSAFTTSWAV